MEGEIFAATKLEIPRPRTGLVPRDDLVALLARPGPHRLTLVAAPAGFGKTTLLSQWATAPIESRPFAWLSLDPDDSDPVRLWYGIIAALDLVLHGIGQQARAALRARGASLTRTAVPLLINDLATRPEPLVLVLDDLHLIEEPEALRALTLLIERAPAGLHVAATARADPPLGLPRMRARGQLLEVRAEDLRFSRDEAAAMLHGLGLDVDPAQLESLQSQTEGWAAGLQLAGLSLRHRPRGLATNPAGGLQIADYLAEEVLDAQGPEVRSFLLRTSVLDRMTGPLCDAVLETTGSSERLDALAEAGLFVVPLDAQRTWFRYHQLFRETLTRRLHMEQPAAAGGLHDRASIWLSEAGLPADAIRHALAAGEGAELIARHWRTYFNRGELATVAGWLAALPPKTVDRDPELWLARAWLALDTGRLDDLPAMLRTAEEGGTDAHRAWAALLRAVHAFKSGDLTTAVDGIDRARGSGDPSPFYRAVASVLGGAIAYWRGSDAQHELRDALRIARQDGNRLAETYALGYLSLAAAEAGDRTAAGDHLAAAEALLEADPGLDEHFVALTVHLARTAESAQRGERAAALSAAARAVELGRRGGGVLEIAETLRALAHARRLAGDQPGSRRALAEAHALVATCADPGPLGRRLGGPEPPVDPEGLSERELDVLRLLATDLSQREIGAELYVSMNTIKTHVKNIFFKLRVGSRDEAVGRARDLGLL